MPEFGNPFSGLAREVIHAPPERIRLEHVDSDRKDF
jgi:hypothetical protein